MKNFYILVIFVMLVASPMLLGQNTRAIPNFDQVEEITISSHRGWMLEIRPDGSGKLIYGSNGDDIARIAQQTFSFRDIYNLLVSQLSGDYPGEKAFSVFLHVKNLPPGTPTYAFYLNDRSTIKEIMSKARDKAIPVDPERFKELLKKRSPVPDDSQ